MWPERVGAHAVPMFSHHITEALVAERQQALRAEARQHHLGRIARLARGRQPRSAQTGPLPSPPAARLVPHPHHTAVLPAAAALAAWKRDQRAA